MKTLDELIAKTDKILATLNEHGTALDIVCESQGKLLAALNEANSKMNWAVGFLEGWQSRIDKQFSELDAKVMATGNGLADEIRHLTAAVSYFAKSALRKKPRPKRRKR